MIARWYWKLRTLFWFWVFIVRIRLANPRATIHARLEYGGEKLAEF